MKKVIVTLVFVLAVTLSYGQSKIEKMAKSNTKEMVKVLSLDTDQEAEIYAINLDKNEKLAANIADASQSAEEMKANKRAIYKEAQQAFRTALGKDKVKEWNVYKNAQTAAKKKK